MKLEVYQIVVGGYFKNKIDFEKLAKKTKYKFHWDEETCWLFGFWLEKPKAHFTVFGTGKFIVNGVKTISQTRKAINIIEKEITRVKAWK